MPPDADLRVSGMSSSFRGSSQQAVAAPVAYGGAFRPNSAPVQTLPPPPRSGAPGPLVAQLLSGRMGFAAPAPPASAIGGPGARPGGGPSSMLLSRSQSMSVGAQAATVQAALLRSANAAAAAAPPPAAAAGPSGRTASAGPVASSAALSRSSSASSAQMSTHAAAIAAAAAVADSRARPPTASGHGGGTGAPAAAASAPRPHTSHGNGVAMHHGGAHPEAWGPNGHANGHGYSNGHGGSGHHANGHHPHHVSGHSASADGDALASGLEGMKADIRALSRAAASLRPTAAPAGAAASPGGAPGGARLTSARPSAQRLEAASLEEVESRLRRYTPAAGADALQYALARQGLAQMATSAAAELLRRQMAAVDAAGAGAALPGGPAAGAKAAAAAAAGGDVQALILASSRLGELGRELMTRLTGEAEAREDAAAARAKCAALADQLKVARGALADAASGRDPAAERPAQAPGVAEVAVAEAAAAEAAAALAAARERASRLEQRLAAAEEASRSARGEAAASRERALASAADAAAARAAAAAAGAESAELRPKLQAAQASEEELRSRVGELERQLVAAVIEASRRAAPAPPAPAPAPPVAAPGAPAPTPALAPCRECACWRARAEAAETSTPVDERLRSAARRADEFESENLSLQAKLTDAARSARDTAARLQAAEAQLRGCDREAAALREGRKAAELAAANANEGRRRAEAALLSAQGDRLAAERAAAAAAAEAERQLQAARREAADERAAWERTAAGAAAAAGPRGPPPCGGCRENESRRAADGARFAAELAVRDARIAELTTALAEAKGSGAGADAERAALAAQREGLLRLRGALEAEARALQSAGALTALKTIKFEFDFSGGSGGGLLMADGKPRPGSGRPWSRGANADDDQQAALRARAYARELQGRLDEALAAAARARADAGAADAERARADAMLAEQDACLAAVKAELKIAQDALAAAQGPAWTECSCGGRVRPAPREMELERQVAELRSLVERMRARGVPLVPAARIGDGGEGSGSGSFSGHLSGGFGGVQASGGATPRGGRPPSAARERPDFGDGGGPGSMLAGSMLAGFGRPPPGHAESLDRAGATATAAPGAGGGSNSLPMRRRPASATTRRTYLLL